MSVPMTIAISVQSTDIFSVVRDARTTKSSKKKKNKLI